MAEKKNYRLNDKAKVVIEGWMVNAGIVPSAALVLFARIYGSQKRYGEAVSEFSLLQLSGADFSGSPEDMARRKNALKSIAWLKNEGLVIEAETTTDGRTKKSYTVNFDAIYIPEECR